MNSAERCVSSSEGDGRAEGERRLVAAMLEDAIACFQLHRLAMRPSKRRLFEDAEAWIMSEEMGPFSFEYVCNVLGFDADWIRRSLIAWETAMLDATRTRRVTVTNHAPASARLRRGARRDRSSHPMRRTTPSACTPSRASSNDARRSDGAPI
jgi:hypothetical protein